MENQNSNKGLFIIICILCVLVLALGGFIIYDKALSKLDQKNEGNSSVIDNNKSTENDIQNVNTIESLINSVKITNLTFDKPRAGGIGGEPYTLATNMTVNLACTNDAVAGIQISGYCLDKSENKYFFEGPAAVMAFYCDNNVSHEDKGTMQAYRIFKNNGSNYVIPEQTQDIKWEDIEIKYCKFDKANLMLTDGTKIDTEISINYEKAF